MIPVNIEMNENETSYGIKTESPNESRMISGVALRAT
jgi:hypothetical protein